MESEIVYSFKDCYELQLIDCNCNNCVFMQRDLDKYKKREDYHKNASLLEFEQAKAKAIKEAQEVIDNSTDHLEKKSGEGMLRVANKMRFQFEKKFLLNYGKCLKFNRDISFLPMTCQIETQSCFQHRKANK